jgi:hypothetical protein
VRVRYLEPQSLASAKAQAELTELNKRRPK